MHQHTAENRSADPIVPAIDAYLAGCAAYCASGREDEETADATYGPHLEILEHWEQPAVTREGAAAALRLALSELNHGEALACALISAALAYLDPIDLNPEERN
jgi:hypothetical protein